MEDANNEYNTRHDVYVIIGSEWLQVVKFDSRSEHD